MKYETHDVVRERLLSEHPAIREEYERLRPRYEVIAKLISARHELNLTQAQLAERMGPTQNTISRLESGESNPRLDTLVRAAHALGRDLTIEFVESGSGSNP
ncbi:MAG: helix-turn-helix transcriptional regulator [Chloroflexi bacterium]|nr:helix-turn-helix transcriptional regulator [Chloroflexota bacterium]